MTYVNNSVILSYSAKSAATVKQLTAMSKHNKNNELQVKTDGTFEL